MRRLTSPAAALACAALFAAPAAGQAKVAVTGPSGGGASASVRAVHAETVVVGKVTEIEKDTVEGPAYANAPKDQKASYKIAFLKIEDPLIGARGLTLLLVGFLADAPASLTPAADGPPGGGRIARPRPVAVALTVGMEGCFFLDPMPGADFYILSGNGPPLIKGNDNYEKELKTVQVIVKALDDPVAALKAKELDDRFRATQALLLRYQSAKGNPARFSREAIPAEENKLILGVLAELPWLPKDGAPRVAGEVAPSRSAIWHSVNWNEHGFRPPKNAPGGDYNQLMDEASAKFLKENAEKIQLKRIVAGK